MKLKALLLGSAAAMIAVSGAQAADAPIAEPEPVEYVKVCDMYGSGFFYIPGTETCLKISGEVRTDYVYRDNETFFDADDTSESAFVYRIRLNFDARDETDYGTLRSRIRLEGGDGPGSGDANVDVDRATIQLGGFKIGFDDTFTTTFHNYGLPVDRDGGFYGFDEAIFAEYVYSANGFSVGAGLQDSGSAGAHIDWEYYVGARYAGSWGSVAASYLYEEAVDEGSIKGSIEVKAIENLLIKAWVQIDDGATKEVAGNGDYTFGVGARYDVSDSFYLAGGWSQAEDFGQEVNRIEIEAGWNPVPNLTVIPNVIFQDEGTPNLGTESTQFGLRVIRSF